MSGNGDEDKTEPGKSFPLDLAAKITTVKTVDCKTPLIMTGQALRNMRVLTPSSSVQTSLNTGNIITTNILSQAVLKQGEVNRSQGTNIANTAQPQQSISSNVIQRPTHITLTASLPVVAQSPTGTYHVPRGPAVVANLAAPRSNVATAIRNPMIVNTQTGGQSSQAFVRPPRTPSPAQGTAWLTTNSSNGSQIKGAPTVLSSPVRGASVSGVSAIGKPQIVTRTQTVTQTVSSIRPTTTILHSAITIGQGGQLHPFKSGQSNTGIQALTNNTVTLAQVLPARTQTLVYSTGGNTGHLVAPPRIAVSSSVQNRQSTAPKTGGQVTTRLTMPVNVTPATRLVTPQGAVLNTGTRVTTTSSAQQATILGSNAPARIVSTTQPAVAIGRVTVTPSQNSPASNVIGQSRISTLSLHPLVVANTSQPRTIQAQGAKVITQTAQGTAIHLTQMPATIKPTQTIVTTAARTINVQPIVTQRTLPSVSSQAIPIAKVFPPQAENQPVVTPSAGVFIHAPPVAAISRRSSPGPTSAAAVTTVVTNSVATYSLASGTYFYDATGTYSVAHSFNQSPFATVPQSASQQIKPAIATQVHGIVTNQQMRFNPVMVLEQNRAPQYSQSQQSQQQQQDAGHEQSQVCGGASAQMLPTQTQKVTSSPRPSILRKRDHEGSPLKAAKNLNSSLVSAMIPQQSAAPPPISPPSRPDSGGNENSSGGSTTVSATSSPGVAETNEDSMPHVPSLNKEEENNRPPTEMSPRKKPRKQQFGTGSNDLDENMNDDMQFITDGAATKKDADSDENRSDCKEETVSETRVIRKPATPSLLNSYRQTWKATHNHYLRYSDVRPKDERRPTIMDLANQYRVLEKVNGWKIHHLSTQMEDLADEEQAVYDQLTRLLKFTEAEEKNSNEREINHINELIKGNLQRIKIINDGMVEAKSQIMKIFDHKIHVTDIINRCASKRNFKKREKS